MGLPPFQPRFWGAIQRECAGLGACGAPLFPSFTHENSFLSLPTSASLLPQCLPKVFPPLLHHHTKPTSWFQLRNQGGSPGFYLQVFGGRQGRGGGGERHILEEIKFVQRNEAEEWLRCLLICNSRPCLPPLSIPDQEFNQLYKK